MSALPATSCREDSIGWTFSRESRAVVPKAVKKKVKGFKLETAVEDALCEACRVSCPSQGHHSYYYYGGLGVCVRECGLRFVYYHSAVIRRRPQTLETSKRREIERRQVHKMQVLRALMRPIVTPAHSHNPIRSMSGGLAEFFESGRDPASEKKIVYGRSWKASELRLKSWDDLHKLWYVFLKEKNMLLSQKQMLLSQSLRMPNPERMSKVRKSMCRLKQVLTERALQVEDRQRRNIIKRMINSM